MGINRRYLDQGLQQIYGISGTDGGSVVNESIIVGTQRKVGSMSAGSSSVDVTITEVDLDNSVVLYNGAYSSTIQTEQQKGSVEFLDSTTVRVKRGRTSGGITVRFTVLEFKSSAIVSIQHGEDAETLSTAVTTDNSAIFFRGARKATDDVERYVELASSTSVTSTGSGSITIAWTVIDFSSDVISTVAEFLATSANQYSNLTGGFNLFSIRGNTVQMFNYGIEGVSTNNAVTFDTSVPVTAVGFSKGIKQSFLVSAYFTTESSQQITIPEVDLDKTALFYTVGGTSNGDIYQGNFAWSLNSTTKVLVARGSTDAIASLNPTCYLVEFY